MKECKDGRVLWDLRVSLDTRVSYPGIYTSYSTNSRILRTSCVTAVPLYIRRQSCAPGNDQCCINRYIIPGVLHLITMYSDRGHTPHLFVIYFEVAMHRAWLLCDEFQKNAFQKNTELRLRWDLNPGPLFFITEKTSSVSPDQNLKPRPLLFVYNG